MSLDDFEAADFVPGHRYELIHGVLVVTPIPRPQERDANEELGHWLRNYQESHPGGKALDLTLPEHNLRTVDQNRRADRVLWIGLGRLPVMEGPVAAREVPAIVVEFTSSRPADQRRDYQEKRFEYREIGVREYWIVDRFRRTLSVYYGKGAAAEQRVLGETETYATPELPGFELRLEKLLAVSDKYRRRAGI